MTSVTELWLCAQAFCRDVFLLGWRMCAQSIIMVALWNRTDHYIFVLCFLMAALCHRGIIFSPVVSSIFFLSFVAYSQPPSQIGCLPYLHIWCGLSANLRCRSETWCTRLDRWKYRTQKLAKKSPSRHYRTSLSGYIFATKARIDNRKKTSQAAISPQYLLQTSPRVWWTSAH